jgi:phage gp45-like
MVIVPGKVTGRETKKNQNGDHNVLMLQCTVSEQKDARSIELMTQHGQKCSPPNNSRIAIIEIGGSWKVAIACDDTQAPGVDTGENRLYSTAEDGGAAVTQIYFKNNGTLEITADTLVSVQAPDIQANADNDIVAVAGGNIQATAGIEAEVTAPQVTINGNVQINGNTVITGTLSAMGGQAVMSGGTFQIPNIQATNDIDAGGDVTADGISLHDHVHSDPQGGTVGAPQ